jgi:hypothetical protein
MRESTLKEGEKVRRTGEQAQEGTELGMVKREDDEEVGGAQEEGSCGGCRT